MASLEAKLQLTWFSFGFVPELKRPTRCYLFTILTSDVVCFTWRIRRHDGKMLTSETPLLQNDASSLLLNQNVRGLRKTPVADIRLVAPAEGAFRRAKNERSHPRGVFLISPRCSSLLTASPRQHGNSGGERPRHRSDELSPIRSGIFKSFSRPLDETWIAR